MLSDSSPASSSSRRNWWIIGAIILIAAAVLLLMFEQGGLLSARVFSSQSQETASENEDSATPGNLYAQKEHYCQAEKEAFIVDCGDVIPEKDYTCRTKEADDFYNQCLLTATDEQVKSSTYDPRPVDASEPSQDL